MSSKCFDRNVIKMNVFHVICQYIIKILDKCNHNDAQFPEKDVPEKKKQNTFYKRIFLHFILRTNEIKYGYYFNQLHNSNRWFMIIHVIVYYLIRILLNYILWKIIQHSNIIIFVWQFGFYISNLLLQSPI